MGRERSTCTTRRPRNKRRPKERVDKPRKPDRGIRVRRPLERWPWKRSGRRVILFWSLLDEQQRRLYAGLESMKLGAGGDRSLAELLEVDVGTVARGRKELLSGDILRDRVRRVGGGRMAVEKNARRDSED